MKKLYENIEDINIKGSPSDLSEIITAMDISLQNIAEGTEQITAILLRYRESNKGQQYQRAVFTLLALENTLYVSSKELNSMQQDVVAYQNKVIRYEGLSETAAAPNAFLVEKKEIETDVQSVQFNLNEMVEVNKSLNNYSEAIKYHVSCLIQSKNNIGVIWQDSQYHAFSDFIDNICKQIIDALVVFDDYTIELENRIKEIR